MAGIPSRDLSTSERLLVVKPPRVITGKSVFQKEVYFKDKTTVRLEGETAGAVIHYTLDGSEPTVASPVYAGPIPLDRSATMRALAARTGRQSVVSPPVRFELLTGMNDIVVSPDPAPEYSAHGPLTLVDGKRGDPAVAADAWLGFEGNDMEAMVDLGRVRTVSSMMTGFLSNQRSWIFLPASVEYAVGLTRENMRVVFAKKFDTEKIDRATSQDVSAKVKPARARYVRIRAKNVGVCPPWHPGVGRKAWLFVDEITIR